MLTPQQESTLTSAGDSFDHYHSSDREVTHQTLRNLQQIENTISISGVYSVGPEDDIILCSTAATIQFPLSKSGRQLEVVMVGTGNVLCLCTSPDLVYGQPNVLLQMQGTALRFKSVSGGWILL